MKRENDSGGALLLLAHGGPSPGKELVQAIVRPKIDEADENVGEIGLGLYAVQFASLDQRSEDGPIFGAVIVTREESILARKSLRAHGTLDDIGVELDAAVIKKADEAAPMPEAVADDPGGIRSAREPRELMLEEDLERVSAGSGRAGITSSRSEVSSPITCIGFLQHGQFVSAGATVS